MGTLLSASPSNAQTAPTVELHGVRILYGDQVELNFSSNAEGCYLVLNQLGKTRNVGQVCGAGDDLTRTYDRNDFFPPLLMSDILHLRTIIAPIVESNEVNVGGILELHSVTVSGNQVEIEYTKSFPECVLLVREDGEILSEDSSSLCGEGQNLRRILDRGERLPELEEGDNVKLRVIQQPGFESALVNAQGPGSDFQSCVMGENGVALGDRASISVPEVYSDQSIVMGHNAVISADVLSRNNLWAWSSASVNGDVMLSGSLSNQTPSIDGDLFEYAAVQDQNRSWESVYAGWEDKTVWHDTTLVLQPGQYDDVQIGDRSTLVLEESGTYSFSSLKIGNDSTISVNTDFGSVNVEVQKWVQLGDRLRMVKYDAPEGFPAESTRINLYTNTYWLRIPNDGRFRGNITAPNAFVEIGDRGKLTGCVRAKQIRLNNESSILAL